jgi:succinylarginine dihydrolase
VVSSYLFNSQIVTLPDGSMSLIAPTDVFENPRAKSFVDRVLAEPTNPVKTVNYLNLRQSMQNGGGPACLRLRVVLTEDELRAAQPGVFMSEALGAQLEAWIRKHYRDRLAAEDLADPALIDEGRRALDELTQLLGIGSIYAFQG